jgi:hypothetical protein
MICKATTLLQGYAHLEAMPPITKFNILLHPLPPISQRGSTIKLFSSAACQQEICWYYKFVGQNLK